MSRTLLQIINAAQGELGLPISASVIGNSDTTTQQMLYLAQAEIDELKRFHNWTKLHNEYNLTISTPVNTTGTLAANSAVITGIPSTAGITANYFIASGGSLPESARVISVDSATQVTLSMQATAAATATALQFSKDTYPEPSDFERFENRTWYDRTNRWQLLGPDSPQQDQFVRSGIVSLGPRRHFRQIGQLANLYRIWPPPDELVAPLQLVFEYLSTNCIYTAGASPSGPTATTLNALWTLDTDVPILDDRAIIMGIKWRFWAQKGMNYASLRADYDNYCARLAARDGGAPTLSMVPRNTPFLVSANNVQDGNFPANQST